MITVKPQRNLTAREDAELAARLAEKKAGLSKEEIERLVQQTRSLKEISGDPIPTGGTGKDPAVKERGHRNKGRNDLLG